MKKSLLMLCLIQFIFVSVQAQDSAKSPISFDGIYMAVTEGGVVKGKKDKVRIDEQNAVEMYIRFYEDGTVYVQTSRGLSTVGYISNAIGKDGDFEYCGEYTIKKDKITFTVSNSEHPDPDMQGTISIKFKGKIVSSGWLKLDLEYNNGKKGTFNFRFNNIKDTSKAGPLLIGAPN